MSKDWNQERRTNPQKNKTLLLVEFSNTTLRLLSKLLTHNFSCMARYSEHKNNVSFLICSVYQTQNHSIISEVNFPFGCSNLSTSTSTCRAQYLSSKKNSKMLDLPAACFLSSSFTVSMKLAEHKTKNTQELGERMEPPCSRLQNILLMHSHCEVVQTRIQEWFLYLPGKADIHLGGGH